MISIELCETSSKEWHSLWYMTNDFHSFTYCGNPIEVLLNIYTWSIQVYPTKPRSRIIMGKCLKIMNLIPLKQELITEVFIVNIYMSTKFINFCYL